MTLDCEDFGVDDRFRRKQVVLGQFESEYIAWQVKGGDQATTIKCDFIGPDRAGHDLEEISDLLTLAVDFLIAVERVSTPQLLELSVKARDPPKFTVGGKNV
jgi:hypothetical protein